MVEFRILAPELDADANAVRFAYPCPRFGRFEETVRFAPHARIDAIPEPVRTGLLTLAAILIGTSYYKAAPAGRVATDMALTHAARRLAELAYGPGLGEFYVRNALAYPPALEIDAEDALDAASPVHVAPERPRAACAFGGGKDSHVARAILEAAGAVSEPVSVILSPRVGARLQSMTDAPLTLMTRVIDPRLIALSRSGEALNGHIPITGINSCLLALHAAACGQDWVVFANERAASEPTLQADGHPVNHQFSKSLEFEDALRDAFRATGAAIDYFSVLRPVSELWTAHYLARRAPGALDIFASCNRNFVFAGDAVLAEGQRWCGTCSKCVYTGVLMACWLTPERHEAVFQSRPLHDPANLDHAFDIAGLTGAKPWECVGEAREVAAALHHLAADPAWADAPVVAGVKDALSQRWDLAELAATFAGALDARSVHRMPPAVAAHLEA
jgi:UDP-N-acetyl-alpha-D-muramoyl-L-alanyl-L-glutamate epimerase